MAISHVLDARAACFEGVIVADSLRLDFPRPLVPHSCLPLDLLEDFPLLASDSNN